MDAAEDRYDQAFLVTRDSDLCGPLQILRKHFSDKRIKVIAPPMRGHSKELGQLATHRAKIKQLHLENSLFPEKIFAADGTVIVSRPPSYDPPAPQPIAANIPPTDG